MSHADVSLCAGRGGAGQPVCVVGDGGDEIMARGRFLNVSVAKDMRLNSLSVEAELVYLLTIPHLDRDGLIEGDSDVLYGTVCPKRRIFIDRMGEFIQEWVQVGLVIIYDGNEGRVLWFTGFAKNQTHRYDREAPSRFPPPPGYKFGKDGLVAVRTAPVSGATPEQLRTNSGVNPEVDGVNPLYIYNKDHNEVKGGEAAPKGENPLGAAQPTPPTTTPVALPSLKETNGKLLYQSPHVDKTHFDVATGYILAGGGATAVEVYYERFDIRHNEIF